MVAAKVYEGAITKSLFFILIARSARNNPTLPEVKATEYFAEEIKIYDLAKKIRNISGLKKKITKTVITKGSPSRRLPNMTKTLSKIKKKKLIKLSEGLKKTINWYLDETS